MRFSRLSDALDLRRTDVLACVGAGGKTSACWRLWLEQQRGGQPTIFTATTHILEPVLPARTALLLSRQPDPARIRHLLREAGGLVLAASRLAGAKVDVAPNPIAPARQVKLKGLTPTQIDRLVEELSGVSWLIESDGARGRSLKAPAEHEPPIPARASVVAVLAHLDVIGEPLDETTAHRAEQVAGFLRVELGQHLAPEHIVRLMCDPLGGLKNMPAAARTVALLNQSDATRLHPAARSIAHALLDSGAYERVVAASLRAEPPVLEVFVR